MGITRTPAQDPETQSPSPDDRTPAPDPRNGHPRVVVDPEEFHMLLSELRDENSRSRLREALWISIIIHMVALFVLRASPHWLPKSRPVVLSTADWLKDHQLTYLDQPPDAQKLKAKPESSRISDKDRVAMSRNAPDKKLLDALRAARVNEPGQREAQQQQPTPQQQAMNTPPTPPQQQPQQQPPQTNSNSRFTEPQQRPTPSFRVSGTASS